ncbi:MAG: MucB/RseB C-terminal domain-containing protein [Sterolibacterium sp.]|nr:MucB/RseB C-terminal domain-containing protein [Sterolibacterium sp.]
MIWLGRVMTAAREQNYSGTFVYRNGIHAETSRITHVFEHGKEYERLEVLDGSPREVIRHHDEVKCYLPESQTLIVEKRAQRGSFPILLPTSLAGLAEHYVIRKGAVGRVADRDSQLILLEPRDDLRYAHQFWIDLGSGLLLKAGVLNERGESLETFAFTQLQVGASIDRSLLKSKLGAQSAHWRVHHVQATEARGKDEAWLFKVQLPGFRKIAGMKRSDGNNESADNLHMVFSDGLAAISVFVDVLPDKPVLGFAALGAVNVYQRAIGQHLVVVMGEVPRATLKKFADGIEPRKK